VLTLASPFPGFDTLLPSTASDDFLFLFLDLRGFSSHFSVMIFPETDRFQSAIALSPSMSTFLLRGYSFFFLPCEGSIDSDVRILGLPRACGELCVFLPPSRCFPPQTLFLPSSSRRRRYLLPPFSPCYAPDLVLPLSLSSWYQLPSVAFSIPFPRRIP